MDDSKREEARVTDRRHFDREGNVINQSDKSSQSAVAEETSPQHETQEPEAATPPAEFISLIFTFIHTALIHLGDVEDPVQGKKTEDLEMARHMINTLKLLQQKTKGNLTPDEDRYLEEGLFDLRMRFMKKAKITK